MLAVHLQRNIHSIPLEVKQRAYQTVVRPITEYACTLSSPRTAKGIATVEPVQRRADRFVYNDYKRSIYLGQKFSPAKWTCSRHVALSIIAVLISEIDSRPVLLQVVNEGKVSSSTVCDPSCWLPQVSKLVIAVRAKVTDTPFTSLQDLYTDLTPFDNLSFDKDG